jgi:hypothetical protein
MIVISGDDNDRMNKIRRKPPYLLRSALLPRQAGVGVTWASSSRVLFLLPSVLDGVGVDEDITRYIAAGASWRASRV